MNAIAEFKGELAAVSAACLWAVASVVYGRLGQKIPPLALNFSKGAIAIALLSITLFLRDFLLPSLNSDPTRAIAFSNLTGEIRISFLLLLLSGAIGIGIGDTAIFAAINQIGARRTLLLQTLAPPLTAVLATLFLTERLTSAAWCGILITIVGVAWTIAERVTGNRNAPNHPIQGLSFALLAAFSQAIGATLSRAALAANLSGAAIDPLWSSLLRLCSGVALLLVWMLWQNGSSALKPLQSVRLLAIVLVTAFFSTYLGIWLQQISLKFAPAGIAQTLSATSPLFVLPVAIALGEVVSWRAIVGAIVSLSGVALLFVLR